MAHGTIAFDTLTTSDQVNTGTEKSIDTSYIYNGVAKSWCNYASASSFTINDTFNVTSVTDGGAGAGQPQFTNNMANANYSHTHGDYTSDRNDVQVSGSAGNAPAAGTIRIQCVQTGNSPDDADHACITIHGDLA